MFKTTAILLVLLFAPAAHAAEKPNILLILTDDQGWSTLGCYGGKIVPTPNLDKLAKEGARFTDAYVTSQCTPTRATLLTGQYTARSGMWHVIGWYGYPRARMTEPAFVENLPRDSFTLAKGLRAAGYATAICGKWHLTNSDDGDYRGLRPAGARHYGFDHAPPPLANSEFAAGADRGVETLTTQALAFIEQNRNRPWFCYLAHHMIHGEVVAPDDLVQKYRDRGFGDEGPNRAVYLAGLECIDRSVGRLLRRLDELGEAEETLVLFLSDNGGIDERLDFAALGKRDREKEGPVFSLDKREYDNAPLRAGKGSTYEGGTRVPLIARWPKHIPGGTVIGEPVHAVDLLPTCFAVAGASAPAEHPLDGQSLVELLTTGRDAALAERPIYQYYPFYDLRWGLTPNASIRVGDFKLIEFFGDRVDEENRYVMGHRLELYNLREDIGETRNLAEVDRARAETLRGRLHAWLREQKVELPQVNEHYDAKRAFEETREKPQWFRGR